MLFKRNDAAALRRVRPNVMRKRRKGGLRTVSRYPYLPALVEHLPRKAVRLRKPCHKGAKPYALHHAAEDERRLEGYSFVLIHSQTLSNPSPVFAETRKMGALGLSAFTPLVK